MMYDEITPQQLQLFSDEFDTMCQARHEGGAKTYGPIAFLQNNMYQYIAEELVDAANYMRYLYMKLRVWEEVANEVKSDIPHQPTGRSGGQDQLPLGPTSFITTQEV